MNPPPDPSQFTGPSGSAASSTASSRDAEAHNIFRSEYGTLCKTLAKALGRQLTHHAEHLGIALQNPLGLDLDNAFSEPDIGAEAWEPMKSYLHHLG